MPYLSRQGDAGLHHARQKCYYDFRHQLVIYSVGDLIINLMDSVTSIVHGPPLGVTEAWGGQVQVSQVWRRQNVGVFHIMNIQYSIPGYSSSGWWAPVSKGPEETGAGGLSLALDPSGWRHKPMSPALPDGEAFVSTGCSWKQLSLLLVGDVTAVVTALHH